MNFMKNINSDPIFKRFLSALLFFSFVYSNAQDSLRVMSYNLMFYPSGTNYSRETYLEQVVNAYQPDIFAVCELETAQAADDILYNVLRNIRSTYQKAQFEYNHSYGGSLQQFIYYDSTKLHLQEQSYLTTNIRDINHYTFYLKTNELVTDDTIFMDFYVAHLKSSQGVDNEQDRLDMVNVFTQDLQNIPASHYVILAGDLNLYYANEPAYQELIDNTNAIVLQDPADDPGYWHNNSTFSHLHTQSTHSSSTGNFVGGGLDDRFDFILLSENFFQPGSDLTYRAGSFKAFGNNGNCFNRRINDPACTGEFSQTLRDNLYQMSDHLPVVCTLETSARFNIEKQNVDYIKIFPNPSSEYIVLGEKAKEGDFIIINTQGQVLDEINNYQGEKHYIRFLKPGIYYVISKSGNFLPVSFIKK